MKKYFVFLPLISSCNGFSNANSMVGSEYQGSSNACYSGVAISDFVSAQYIAVAGKPKNAGETNQEDSVYIFGEDACFYHVNNQNVTIGIADGVGASSMSMRKHSQRYATKIMQHTNSSINNSPDQSPKELLWSGYNKTYKELQDPLCHGSTTAVVAVIRGDQLAWANVGDSVIMVVRENRVLVKSIGKEYGFNNPYVLSMDKESDHPDQAEYGKCVLQKGDVVIVSTDGMTDNLDDEKIISEITPSISAQKLSNNLVEKAFNISKDPDAEPPFRRKAMSTDPTSYKPKGGKQDDITVAVYIHH